MAVIPAFPGLEVNICVDKIPLLEYETAEEVSAGVENSLEAVPTVIRFVESVAGQQFSIRSFVNQHFRHDCPSLFFDTQVDGVSVGGRVYLQSQHGLNWEVFNEGPILQRVSCTQDTIMPYKFSDIKTFSNDDAFCRLQEHTKRMEKTGQIVVEVWRMGKTTPAKPTQLSNNAIAKLSSNLTVHEKATKGQAKYHGVSLGAARPCALSVVECELLDTLPIAKFIFKYRSREALKHLMIIERSPEPEEPRSPSPPPVNLDKLNAEQRRQLDLFAQRLLKGDDASCSPSVPRTKRERDVGEEGGSSSKKPRKSGEIITIDLTDD